MNDQKKGNDEGKKKPSKSTESKDNDSIAQRMKNRQRRESAKVAITHINNFKKNKPNWDDQHKSDDEDDKDFEYKSDNESSEDYSEETSIEDEKK